MQFNPNEHMMQLKSREGSKDYLPVQYRLVWFRQECPNGTIDTEEVEIDLDREMEEEVYVWNNEKRKSEKVIKRAKGYARFKAIVTDGKGGRATATKSECAASFSDYIEKAETGSVGRALAMLGYGTAFAPELNENHRIVDSPLDPGTSATVRPSQDTTKTSHNGHTGEQSNGVLQQDGLPILATEQQLISLRKLSEHLGKASPATDTTTYEQAKDLLAQLSQEYRSSRTKAS